MGGTGSCEAENEQKRTGPETGRLGTTACSPGGQRGPCVVTRSGAGKCLNGVLSFSTALVSSQRPLPASTPTSLPRDPEFTHSLIHSLAHPFVYLRFFRRAGHSESQLRRPSHPYNFLHPHKLEGGFSLETSCSVAASCPQALVLSLRSVDSHLLALLHLCGGRPGAHDSWGHRRSLAGPSSTAPLPAVHQGA